MGFSRRRREIEPKWCSEYVLEKYGEFPHSFRYPLGPIPQGLIDTFGKHKATRTFRPSRPEVDALVVLPRHLIFLEAKIFKARKGVGDLAYYATLRDSTEELEQYADKELWLQLLLVRSLPAHRVAAKHFNIEIIEWAPDWILEIFKERDEYWTPASTARRELRKQRLEELGY